MILVTNDNPYGLMVVLSYMCRIVHKAMLERLVGVKVAIRRNEVQVQDESTRKAHMLEACHSYVLMDM